MKYLLIVVLLLVVSCDRRQNFANTLNSWVGHRADKAMMELGAPQAIVDLGNGRQMLEYTSREEVYRYNELSNSVYVHTYSCSWRFLVNAKGVIESTNYDGNRCY